jgi:hypothetical protein
MKAIIFSEHVHVAEAPEMPWRLLSKIVPLCSGFSFIMPNNYIIGSDVDTAEVAAQRSKKQEKNIPSVI